MALDCVGDLRSFSFSLEEPLPLFLSLSIPSTQRKNVVAFHMQTIIEAGRVEYLCRKRWNRKGRSR